MRDLDALADEITGDGTGEALPPVLEIPEDAPQCYGNPPEDAGWDQSRCGECEVLDLCREYGRIVESLEQESPPTDVDPMASKRCPLAYAGMLAYPNVGAIDSERNKHVMCIEEDCAWWSKDAGRCGVVPVFATLEVVEEERDAQGQG